MRFFLNRQADRSILHPMMALWLFLFLGWIVPHHACDHTPKELHSASKLVNSTDSHSLHNPDLCQLCKTHGQLDLLADLPDIARIESPRTTCTAESQFVLESQLGAALSPRAPPSIA